MKRYTILTVTIVICSLSVQAQFLGGLFSQKKTQTKLLVQQIAALKVYADYLKKGYDIANKGLTTISDIKHGDLDLHSAFFGSLKTINPNVKQYAKVADIIAMQIKVIGFCHDISKQIKSSGFFEPEELIYLEKVFDRVLDNCNDTLDDLILVTTNNRVEMKDDERLKRIDDLYEQMLSVFSFINSFGGDALRMAAFRKHESNEVQFSKGWFELPENITP